MIGPELSNQQRDALMETVARDGFAVLPDALPTDLHKAVLSAVDTQYAEAKAADPDLASFKLQNIVDRDPAFRQLMMYTPALQLAHDAFGPSFHLNQSNCQVRIREAVVKSDFLTETPWHADGPRPKLFPKVNGAMGLHYLKFGYFLTDLSAGGGSSLEVVRGSHTRPEKDDRGGDFDIADYADDHVVLDVPAGTVVAFHQALWHAAGPNLTDQPRKSLYISYCPTWMRPLDRQYPRAGEMAELSPAERFLLAEDRPPLRWWLPNDEDRERLARYARSANGKRQ